MTIRVEGVTAAMERLFPPETAESWDHVGLTIGDPKAEVRSIAFAVDPCEASVNEAITRGADMLITHHPLYLRGTHSVAATSAKGRWTTAMIRAGVAQFSAHTNADVAASTLALARLLNVTIEGPLDELSRIGGIGTLAQPMRLADFGALVAKVLPHVPAGVLVGGSPDLMVSKVAICSGSGDSFLNAANEAGADVYLTADLRHHPATDHLWNGGCALVSATHWATEWPLLSIMADRLMNELTSKFGPHEVTTYVSEIPTDAWAIRL